MCVYVCMFYIYTYTHVGVYMCVYLCRNTRVCIYTYRSIVCVYMHVCMCVSYCFVLWQQERKLYHTTELTQKFIAGRGKRKRVAQERETRKGSSFYKCV